MTIAHYKNTLVNIDWVKKGMEDMSLIQTYQMGSDLDFNQETVIDKQRFTIKTGSGPARPLGISSNALTGKFRVVEKWENPYWKSANRFYYPSARNPLGQYIIILGHHKTNKKIYQGIHQWPGFEFDEGGFKQGTISNHGCIRTKPSDMQKIFEDIKLGSSILFR